MQSSGTMIQAAFSESSNAKIVESLQEYFVYAIDVATTL